MKVNTPLDPTAEKPGGHGRRNSGPPMDVMSHNRKVDLRKPRDTLLAIDRLFVRLVVTEGGNREYAPRDFLFFAHRWP
jgi:hypothetical protein